METLRAELIIICSTECCEEEVLQDDLTEWKLRLLLQGRRKVTQCSKCLKLGVPRVRPRCELTCPECGKWMGTDARRGQAHEHISPTTGEK